MPCRSPGPHPGGKLRGLDEGYQGPHLGIEVPASAGCLLQGVSARGGVRRPPATATAAGGTHPTEMHSCYFFKQPAKLNFLKKPAKLNFATYFIFRFLFY